jgi:hypothetical protein
MSVTVQFVDSFGHYTTFQQKYDAIQDVADACTIGSAAARSGSYGMVQPAHSGSSGTYASKSISGLPSQVVTGFAVRFTSPETSVTRGIVSFIDVSTIQVEIAIDPAGFIKAYRGGTGGTLLGTSASAITVSNYNYVEVNVKIHASSGSVNVWVNGVLALSLSGINTLNSATAEVTSVRLGANQGSYVSFNYIHYADYYIGTATGATDHLGDVAVLCRFPTANGTTNDYTATFASFINNHAYVVGERFKDGNNNVQECTIAGTSQSSGTPTWATTGGSTTTSGGATFAVVGSGSNPGAANWMAVSERPPDENSSYVTDATVGHIDRYTFPSISGSQVFAVAVNIRTEKDDAGTRTIRAAVKSGGTAGDNGSDFALTLNTYADFQGLLLTDPNTGVAWTASGVNAAEFGIKTTA